MPATSSRVPIDMTTSLDGLVARPGEAKAYESEMVELRQERRG